MYFHSNNRIKFSGFISIVCILLFNSNARCGNSNVVRISVSNGKNSDETIILFNPSASNGYDAYDSQKMFNNTASMPEIYTIADGQLLVINGLTSIATSPTQILGFKTLTAGNFTITATQINGLAGISIILEDLFLHKTQNLAKSPMYSFTSDVCNTTNRFVLHFNTSSALWNGTENWSKASNWLNASIPSSGTDVVIESGELTCNNNYKTADLTINPTAKLTINTNDTLYIQGNLAIKSNDLGTGTIVDNGTLIVSGTTTIEQYVTSNRNWYISSPISEATSNSVKSVNGNKMWQYNEQYTSWEEILNNTTILEPRKGYVANVLTDDTLIFVGGNLNTGLQTINNLKCTGTSKPTRGFNLIGNPYISSLNWGKAVADGLTENLETTIWYRTQNGSSYVFDTYNATSDKGTHNYGGTDVTGIIPPMQAVWVRVDADNVEGSVTFNNAMRSHPTVGNKLKADANSSNVVRLQVANGSSSDETILVFNSNASNGYDSWDSQKMFAENADVPQIYTTVGDEKVVINGLESTSTNSSIPLGFKTAEAGTFTISATEINGVGAVVLEDKLLNKTQDLTGSVSYTFTSDIVDNTSRFALRLKANNSTTNVTDVLESTIAIVVQNHSIVVITSQTSGTITVYDLLGRVLETKTIAGTKTVLESPVGVYFVNIQTAINIETKKIIIE